MEIQEFALKKAKDFGADDVIITLSNSLSRQVKFVNNEIAVTKSWDYKDMDIFLSWKKRLLFTTVTVGKNSKSAVESSIKKLLKIAKFMGPKDYYEGIAKGPFKYKRLKGTYDKKIQYVEGENIDLTEKAINSALEEKAERCSGVLYSGVGESRILTSEGIDSSDAGTFIQISIRAFSKENSGHSVSVSRTLNNFEPEKAGREAGFLASLNLEKSNGIAGNYNAILGPMASANLFSYMSYAFSAFSVDAGYSFLENKINGRVANENLSLIDDGTLENGLSSRKFDAEGRPVQRTEIIKNGILKTYLHNTSTARKFNAEPTGNAGIINPAPWNLILEPNTNKNSEKLISEVDHGIYITNVWYTRFSNYRTGDFSTIPRDAIIEIKNGQFIKNLKGLRISDNMQNFLFKISEISKDSKQVQWWEVSTPVITGHVLVNDLRMSKSTK